MSPKYVSVPIAAVTVWLLIVGGSYKRVQNVFLALSFVFVTYIAAVLAQPDWNDAHLDRHSTGYRRRKLDIARHRDDRYDDAPWMMFFKATSSKGNDQRALFEQKMTPYRRPSPPASSHGSSS